MTTDNYPSWDAKAWLAEFEPSKMVQGGTRPVRAKVFQSTLEIVTKGGYKAPSGITIRFDNLHNGKTLRDNVFCEKEISLKNVEHKYTTEYKVVNQDCLAYAKTLFDQDYTDDLCVLNMASPKNPEVEYMVVLAHRKNTFSVAQIISVSFSNMQILQCLIARRNMESPTIHITPIH